MTVHCTPPYLPPPPTPFYLFLRYVPQSITEINLNAHSRLTQFDLILSSQDLNRK